MKILYSLLPFLLIVSCAVSEKEIFNPSYEPEVSVFGVIGNDPAYEFVIVERTLTLNEDYEDSTVQKSLIIRNARVLIASRDDTVEFHFWEDPSITSPDHPDFVMARGVYLDTENALSVKSDQTYALTVILDDGRCVTGETTIPKAPVIFDPSPSDTLNVSEICDKYIRWIGSSTTFAYLPQFLITTAYNIEMIGRPYQFNILSEINVLDEWVSLEPVYSFFKVENTSLFLPSATIKIIAMDQNMYDFTAKSGLADMVGQSLNLLEGGIGVFGSMSADSLCVRLAFE